MKRLFYVEGKKPIRMKDVPESLGYSFTHKVESDDILYFEKKQDAKTLRNLLPFTCRVRPGPDHWKRGV